MKSFMPAEWELQDAIQITWPSNTTDWNDNIMESEKCFLQISQLISKYQKLIIIHANSRNPKELFNAKELRNIIFIEADYNDTWSRDYAPISIIENGIPKLKNFNFNGWGNKFESTLDNELNQTLLKYRIYKNLSDIDFILEGGSIDSNGDGVILTTKKCLLNSNRNSTYSFSQIDTLIKKELHAKKILWLEEGEIIGDDTDAHIDMLARFINENSILYVKSFDESNPNFGSLNKMELELKQFTNLRGESFNLIPIPLPSITEGGIYLPATYANFLITNKQVLLPIYNCPEDGEVIKQFKTLFPDKDIEPVFCGEIIKQNGSIHCLTMQLHKNTVALNLFDHE
jgi:agmatine/peptidylarginine deiminase